MRPAGSRHSFTPLCATDGVAVDLHGLAGVEAIDVDARTATVLAGTRLSAIGDELRAAGLALHNQGDVDTQTVSGATGTGTHGTGPDLGNLSTAIVAVRIVDRRRRDRVRERGRASRAVPGGALVARRTRHHHRGHVPVRPRVQPPRAGVVRRPRQQPRALPSGSRRRATTNSSGIRSTISSSTSRWRSRTRRPTRCPIASASASTTRACSPACVTTGSTRWSTRCRPNAGPRASPTSAR